MTVLYESCTEIIECELKIVDGILGFRLQQFIRALVCSVSKKAMELQANLLQYIAQMTVVVASKLEAMNSPLMISKCENVQLYRDAACCVYQRNYKGRELTSASARNQYMGLGDSQFPLARCHIVGFGELQFYCSGR